MASPSFGCLAAIVWCLHLWLTNSCHYYGNHCHIPCSLPSPTPATGPCRTQTGSTRPLNFYSNLLPHLPATYSFLPRHPQTPLRTLPASGHLLYSAPSSCLSFRLTYLIHVYQLASVSLYQTPTPVLTHRTLLYGPAPLVYKSTLLYARSSVLISC